MKLGFICLNLPGHLNPMTALARRLQDRNHEAGATIGTAEADLGLYHPCRIEHGAGVPGSRCSASSHSGSL